MSANVSILRERVRTFNQSVAAGAPAVKLPEHTFKKPKRNFKCYGGSLELWQSSEPRVMISGPAETGKTTAALNLIDHLCWTYPNVQGAIVRKVYADMPGSVLQSYEQKVIGMEQGQSKSPDGITKFGGEKAQFYSYPNGSRIWVCGLDKPGKVLSSERDFVYVNQAEDLTLEDWETISTRTTGRAGVLKPARLIGDCNPGPSTHWIMSLATQGTLRMIKSKHEDNPTLFDPETGLITEQGILSMANLDALTGVRHKRLRLGMWVAAEGVVYEIYDATTHVRDAPLSEIVYHVAGVDWGFSNPGVIQVWGVDNDGRMYRTWEVYHTQKLVAASQPEDAWWIKTAVELKNRFNIRMFACDPSEPAYIEAFQRAGIPCVGAFNHRVLGIQNVESRLKVQPDNRARLYILRGSKAEPDPALAKAHKAACLEDELELYSWSKTKAGKPDKEDPEDKDNHACDAMRYAAAYVDQIGPGYEFLFG